MDMEMMKNAIEMMNQAMGSGDMDKKEAENGEEKKDEEKK